MDSNGNVKVVDFRSHFRDIDETLQDIKDRVEDGTLRNLVTIMRVREKDGLISVGYNWQGKDTFVTYIGLMDYVKMSMYQKEFEGFEDEE